MNRSRAALGAILASVVYGYAFVGCPCSSVPPTKDEGSVIPLPAVNSNLRWLLGGEPIGLADAFGQIDPARPISKAGGCESFKANDWANLPGELASLHQSLIDLAKPAAPSALASEWVLPAQDAPSFEVSFVSRSDEANAGASGSLGNYGAALSVTTSASSIALVIGDVERTIELKPDAKNCLRTSVCALSGGKGGSYASALHYGTMIRLHLKDGTIVANLEAGIGSFALSAGFSQSSLDLQGGFIGRFVGLDGGVTTGSDLKQIYDVPDIIRDLQSHNILTVAQALEARTKLYGVVALTVVNVAPSDCPDGGQ